MSQQLLKWKPVIVKNHRGIEEPGELQDRISEVYRGRLFDAIQSMPRKTPITFERAVRLTNDAGREAFNQMRLGINRGQCSWYHMNFVEWISDLGYHIELTGDEFELIHSTIES